MGKPKSPTPPDPKVTAGAQTGTNISTALANSQLSQVNQVGPDGSLTYDQTGTFDYTDPNTGKVYTMPKTTATTSLSPGQQAIYDQNQGAQLGLAETANQQASFLKDYLGEPADFDTSAIEGRLDELGRARLDPRFERERAATEARLTQQGLAPGSEAWNAAMTQQGQAKNDAYNQLALQGRGQAFGELAAMRNQPINEITALLGGSQVSQPNFQQATPAQMPTIDYAGLVNNNFAQQQQNYQQQMGQYNNTAGGLFGGLSSLITASDVRLKTDISKIGEREGLNLYEYRYNWDEPGTKRRGYMAHEVAKTHPEAVGSFGEYLGLDYAQLPEVS